ncbi:MULTISPECIES: GFA family protein [Pandoraea]|uniref:GFA family protein n=1 Tax=Pandoraea TaxID=93217 RepID=UPI001F5E3274|nr:MULTISPECIES: GFA family protein [Pandoraea]MCI3205206.1 GFA family protein [Pandoraea sp. LA3]MDN4583234.1 GFA family protein [Pandoraea capi]
MSVLQGSCLCGTVKFEIRGPMVKFSHCHCSQCRKGHGAAFASYGRTRRTDLHILAGRESIKAYASSERARREFCAHCGASLFWSGNSDELAEWIAVALGTIDTPFTAPGQKHLHVASKASWYAIDDHLPQFD